MIVAINSIEFILYMIRTIGAIFCHVLIKKQFIHDSPSITSGNQKWNGAAPIFVRRAEFKIAIKVILVGNIVIWIFTIIIIIAIIIVDLARACVIKYLIEASDERLSFSFIIGIMDKRLISNPIHIPSQEYDDSTIIVLLNKVVRNIIL